MVKHGKANSHILLGLNHFRISRILSFRENLLGLACGLILDLPASLSWYKMVNFVGLTVLPCSFLNSTLDHHSQLTNFFLFSF